KVLIELSLPKANRKKCKAGTAAGTAAAGHRSWHRCGGGLFLADEVDGEGGAGLGDAAEADGAFPGEFGAVAPHEFFLAVRGLQEGPVGALVDEQELAAAHL